MYHFGSNRDVSGGLIKTTTAVFATSILHSQDVSRKQNKRQSFAVDRAYSRKSHRLRSRIGDCRGRLNVMRNIILKYGAIKRTSCMPRNGLLWLSAYNVAIRYTCKRTVRLKFSLRSAIFSLRKRNDQTTRDSINKFNWFFLCAFKLSVSVKYLTTK